ncbi:MAG: NAD(P)/FAD-dependent oxidoreductase [Actinomycetota bacterium]
MRGSAAEQPVILGAGPAGLTAGYLLAQRGAGPIVLEALGGVGGLARTEVRDGFRFDLGGHRFFTKSREVEALWRETLGDELLRRPRLSRIYYRRRMIDYPLSGPNLVRVLGPGELARALSSYLVALARRPPEAETYEDWVSQRFGQRLYEMFFRSYTEKVWGVPCRELRAEWAAQRIRGLSFAAAARSALPGGRNNRVRSLINEFHYPRLGPGQMWEAMRDRIVELGGCVRTGAPVERIRVEGARVSEVAAAGESIPATQVISSLPLPVVAGLADPAPPRAVLDAAAGLRYRDFVTVALVLEGSELFPDNWIYVHEPGVRVARIQNFRAWSPSMVPDPGKSCVGLEYFCFQGDELWSLPDEELVELATREFDKLRLGERDRVLRGYVVRVPKAYPIYDEQYAGRLATIRRWLTGIDNLQQVGRNGLHRYNNSDHSMLTAMRAVENLNGANHDLWAVNADSWYHETEVAEEQPYRSPSETAELARAPG